jgi:hypothetical protein
MQPQGPPPDNSQQTQPAQPPPGYGPPPPAGYGPPPLLTTLPGFTGDASWIGSITLPIVLYA